MEEWWSHGTARKVKVRTHFQVLKTHQSLSLKTHQPLSSKNLPIPGLTPSSELEIPLIPTLKTSTLEDTTPKKPYTGLLPAQSSGASHWAEPTSQPLCLSQWIPWVRFVGQCDFVYSLASDCQNTFPLRAAALTLGPHMMWTEKLQAGNLAWVIRPVGASDKEIHISNPPEIYHVETAGELSYGWNLPSPKLSFCPINCPRPLCRVCTKAPRGSIKELSISGAAYCFLLFSDHLHQSYLTFGNCWLMYKNVFSFPIFF